MAQFEDLSLVNISLYGEGMPETPGSGNSAEVGFEQAGISLSLLTLEVDYAFEHYHWNKLDKLAFGNGNDAPWENLHMLSVTGMYGGEITEKWSYLALANGSTAFEDGADNSYLNGILAGAGMYNFSEAWNFIAGAGVIYSNAPDLEFEDLFSDAPEFLPLPVLGVQWNQNATSGLSASVIFPLEATVQFKTVDQRLATSLDALAQKADVTVQFSPMFGTTLSCELNEGGIYRLAKDNISLPVDQEEAYLNKERGLAELMLNVALPGNFSLNVGPYYAFDQKLSVVDKNTEDLRKLELDDTFGAKFEIAWNL
jgi:hypothetical protein